MNRSTGTGVHRSAMLRVGEQVRHALSELLQRGEIRDRCSSKRP